MTADYEDSAGRPMPERRDWTTRPPDWYAVSTVEAGITLFGPPECNARADEALRAAFAEKEEEVVRAGLCVAQDPLIFDWNVYKDGVVVRGGYWTRRSADAALAVLRAESAAFAREDR